MLQHCLSFFYIRYIFLKQKKNNNIESIIQKTENPD